jgi:hypothetical protein
VAGKGKDRTARGTVGELVVGVKGGTHPQLPLHKEKAQEGCVPMLLALLLLHSQDHYPPHRGANLGDQKCGLEPDRDCAAAAAADPDLRRG